MTLLKLFLMTHHIPVKISTNEGLTYYKTVSKMVGRKLEHSLYGYVIH